jgi:hypothetical protein
VSVQADIEDAVRGWLALVGEEGGIPDADSAVVIADQDAVRPPLPYLVVRVDVYDLVVHTDETSADDSDPPVWQTRGQRTGTVSVNAYGPTAAGWLERAVLMLRAPSVQALLSTAGLTIRPEGGARNLSGLLDDATQARLQRDFFVDYGTDTGAEAVLELAEAVHADTWESDHPSDLTETVTEVL